MPSASSRHLAIVIMAIVVPLVWADRTPGAITVQEFYRLPADARKQYVIHSLEEQQDQLSNVFVRTSTMRTNVRFEDGHVGDRVAMHGRDTHEWRRLDGSYRLSCVDYPHSEQQPLFTSQSNYDADTGVARMLAEHRQIGNPTARIAKRHDPIVSQSRMAFFLGGRVDENRVSYQQYVIDHQADVTVPDAKDGDQTAIVVRSDVRQPDGATETRLMRFDPARGMLLVGMDRTWERREKDGQRSFETWDLDVKESRQFGDVWLPVHFLFFAQSQHLPKDVATQYDVRLEDASVGNVTAADLAVVFPVGTEVNDMIEGVQYIAGYTDPASARQSRGWLYVTLVGFALIVGGFLLYRYAGRSS